MPDADEKFTPADPRDLADALAFALCFQDRKRVHEADEIMSEIVARRLVGHLERAGFIVMKRPLSGFETKAAQTFSRLSRRCFPGDG